MQIRFRRILLSLVSVAVFFLVAVNARAASGGGGGGGGSHFIGLNLGFTNATQDQLNTVSSRANLRDGGISVGQLSKAYEGSVQYGYRFASTIIALVFRPSFFYNAEDGTGTSGEYEYGVQGFTVASLIRFYPLEDEFMRFFMQIGPGYGHLSGNVREAAAQAKFSGSSFGAIGGLGAEFCFAVDHCLVAEGNVRYLPVTRNIVKSTSGTFASNSFSQTEVDKELELDQTDVETTMSGVQFSLGYTMYF